MKPIIIIQILLFSAGTLSLVFISRKALKLSKPHGFYRFFVFELTLLLLILNLPFWFEDPFSILQAFSWLSLTFSLLLVIQSIYLLIKHGGKKESEIHPANFKFENTARLVETGIYKYIRHPMYSSLLFLSLGAMLKHITLLTILLFILTLIFLIFTAKVEEKEDIEYFGPAYADYMERTKMFIPFVF